MTVAISSNTKKNNNKTSMMNAGPWQNPYQKMKKTIKKVIFGNAREPWLNQKLWGVKPERNNSTKGP